MIQTEKPAIVWFRRDLRVTDNRALASAVAGGRPIIPVFILDDDDQVPERLGAAARWWLHHSLEALQEAFEHKGAKLILRRGDSLMTLLALAEETGAKDVHVNRGYSPKLDQFDDRIASALTSHGISMKRHSGHLLHEPEQIKSGSGQPYRVFTPFWKAVLNSKSPPSPLPEPQTIHAYERELLSDRLSQWQLCPQKPNWAREFPQQWKPGERAALERLETFLAGDLNGYAAERDIPSSDQATSKLSPHLAFGEISPATIWNAALRNAPESDDRSTFLKELTWRDFCYGLFQVEPNLAQANWNKSFDQFEWIFNEKDFETWKKGQTGYPIVDAGMRQLWRHGTMHNRVRMITASFLIKHLLIDWRHGEAYFADTLVDVDVANNPANWQWVAGSGADASPFFRIFNPILQGEKFDKQGAYVRCFVPELGSLPDKYIHRPFDAPAAVLQKAGVTLGKTYPKPMIDHQFARQRALDAYQRIKD